MSGKVLSFTGFIWDTNMAMVLLFWDTNMAMVLQFWDTNMAMVLLFWDANMVMVLQFWDDNIANVAFVIGLYQPANTAISPHSLLLWTFLGNREIKHRVYGKRQT